MQPIFVTIGHADINGTTDVTEEAFNLVYKDKGWKIVGGDESAKGSKPARNES